MQTQDTQPAVQGCADSGNSQKTDNAVGVPAFWLIFSYALFVLANWLTVTVIARYFGPAPVGLYALGVSLATPVIILGQLQLRQILLADRRGRFPFKALLRLRMLATLVTILVMGLLGLYFAKSLADFMVILLPAMMRGGESISDMYYGLFQKIGYSYKIGYSSAIRAASTTAILLSMCRAGFSLPVTLGTMFIATILVCIFYDRVAADPQAGDSPTASTSVRELARLGMRPGVNGFLNATIPTIPRVMLDRLVGAGELGVFTLSYYLFAVGRIVADAIALAVIPHNIRLADKSSASSLAFIARQLIYALLIGGLGAVLVIWLGPLFLRTFYNKSFANGVAFIKVIGLAMIFTLPTAVMRSHVYSSEAYSQDSVVTAIVLLVTVPVSWILIHRDLGMGAAWSVFVCSALQFVGSVILAATLIRSAQIRRVAGT